jgi:hypothetical protein
MKLGSPVSGQRSSIVPESWLLSTDRLTAEYSVLAWVIAAFYTVVLIPVGWITLVYMYYNASTEGSSHDQLETWTVVLLPVAGIAAVELGGRRGAKYLIWALTGLMLLTVLVIFLGLTALSSLLLVA